MTRSRPTWWLATVVALGLAGALAPAAAARAEAAVFRFQIIGTPPDSTPLPECTGSDEVGSQVATETFAGQVTDTGKVIQVHGRGILTYRVTFADGSHVTGTATDHLAFVANPPLTVFNDVIQEPRTIYSASGEPIGTVFIHALSHLTYQDANGSGTPDPGEISAFFDKFFFTCG